METNLIADTTGRNALYKIHVSLGKIVNNLDQAKEAGAAGRRGSTVSRSASLGPEEHGARASTAAAEDRAAVSVEPLIKEEDEDEDGDGDAVSRVGAHDDNDDDDDDGDSVGTVVRDTTKAEDGDSLVSELLDDDGDTVMG